MRVAITGATGFVGSRLLERCVANGDLVHALSRKSQADSGCFQSSVRWFEGSLDDVEYLKRFLMDVDVLYHCAAEIRNPKEMEQTNVLGVKNLIEASTGSIGRWVQLSSVGAYGSIDCGVVTEDSPENPSDTYEVSKTIADRLVRSAAISNEFEYVLLRPSNIYGQGMTNQSIFQLIGMIDRGMFAFIGPKGAYANYVHVDDVADALVACGMNPAAVNKTYNLSVGDTMEVFVSSISKGLGRPVPAVRLPKAFVRGAASVLEYLPGFPLTRSRVDALSNRAFYAADQIRRELGFVSSINLKDGMEEMARFWKSRQ